MFVFVCVPLLRMKKVSRQSNLFHSKDWITTVSVHKQTHIYSVHYKITLALYFPQTGTAHRRFEGLVFTLPHYDERGQPALSSL